MKKPGRKVRKQRRKNKQQAPSLPDGVKKNLRQVARKMTLYRKYPEELIDIKFYCPTCKKGYCISFTDKLGYCEDCIYKKICVKEIQDIREC